MALEILINVEYQPRLLFRGEELEVVCKAPDEPAFHKVLVRIAIPEPRKVFAAEDKVPIAFHGYAPELELPAKLLFPCSKLVYDDPSRGCSIHTVDGCYGMGKRR